MKRRLISLMMLCCCAASLLVTRAAASDDINVATGDALMRVAGQSSTVTKYQGLFSDSWSFSVSSTQTENENRFQLVALPISITGDHTFVYTLTWQEEYYATVSDVTLASEFFDYIKVSRGDEVEEIDIANDITDFDGFSMYRSISSSAGSSGYIRHVSVSFIVDDPEITNFSFYTQTHKIHSVHLSPITILDISDATLDDVVAQLVKLTNTTSNTNSNTAGIINDAITNLGQQLSESSWQSQEEIKASLSEVANAVTQMKDEMPAAVQEGTKNAMQEFFEDLKKEATESFNKAVTEINESLPIDVSALKGSFDQLYNSVSTHSTSAAFTFPAGTVSLMGQTFTFWDAQQVNFDEFFSLPGMTLLLLPLRFVFVFGMAKYLLHYVAKLEKLITLHTGGGSE